MNPHTLELLEYDKVRHLLAGYASSTLGKELAAQLEPAIDADGIRKEITLTTEMAEAIALGQSPPLGGLHDVRLVVRRAAIGAMLAVDQLQQVAETLTCTGQFYRYRMRLDGRFQGLLELMAPIEDLGTVAKGISGCIDPRGHVLDMASPELADVRRRLALVEEKVQQQIKRLLRDPELRRILRYPNATVSGDHYVLPVSVNYRHKLPGLVHRTSSTGETVFIEPAAIANLSAERVVLKSEEDKEVKRVLRRLSAEVGRIARPLGIAIDIMARVDLLSAKARYSRDYAMSPPHLATDGRLWLRQARHPLLEHLFRGSRIEDRGSKIEPSADPPSSILDPQSSGDPRSSILDPRSSRQVVPIDVRLGDHYNLLVITGPNTGGKTVTLKTVGLLCLMAQSGLHIPAADGSAVPLFHDILADIGDEQSLEQSLSTFSSHMTRIAQIVRQADAHSLVLLDELGAGTDPTEGAALGRAILDQLDGIGCRAMVTTHLGDLKTYAFSNQRAENAAVEFDVNTLKPTYRLLIGQFGMSNALKIARRLKLPRDLLRRAHRYLRRKQKRAPELARLQELREQAEQAREAARTAQHDAAKEQEAYRQKLAELQKQAEADAALQAARARMQPNDAVRVSRFDKPGRIVRIDYKRSVALVSVGLGQWEVPLEEVFPLE